MLWTTTKRHTYVTATDGTTTTSQTFTLTISDAALPIWLSQPVSLMKTCASVASTVTVLRAMEAHQPTATGNDAGFFGQHKQRTN